MVLIVASVVAFHQIVQIKSDLWIAVVMLIYLYQMMYGSFLQNQLPTEVADIPIPLYDRLSDFLPSRIFVDRLLIVFH